MEYCGFSLISSRIIEKIKYINIYKLRTRDTARVDGQISEFELWSIGHIRVTPILFSFHPKSILLE